MIKLEDALQSDNIAELLDEETLTKIGAQVDQGYKEDEESRTKWSDRQDEYMKLALQVMEVKTSPWPGAANVKYPLLTTATMQFGARAYPGLVSGTKIVKGNVTGFDATGEKAKAAERVGKHMSYQLIEEMDEWEEDMDKLCISVPIVGSMFKKTYFSPSKEKNVSELVYPKNLVVNYWTKSLKDAPRITHKIYLSENDVFERIESDLYLDLDYTKTYIEGDKTSNAVHDTTEPPVGDTTPLQFNEQHTWLDLDEDGYKEPYIVTVHEEKVARIVVGFEKSGIKRNSKGGLVRINRIEYFTKYGFVPNPDGSFYDVGFGLLLGPINETINTTINQLLDAGTMSVRSGGFLGRGARLKGGVHSFKPFEWQNVLSTGDDLRKSMVPLPVREPSQVLFSLLGMMIESGKELSNTVPMLMGQNPGQNQPATTSMAVIEQGLKVYSAIFKRLHRALKQELKKLKRLNKLYLPIESYFQVLDPVPIKDEEGNIVEMETALKILQEDYSDDITDVQPYSDPNIVAEVQRMIKAQQVSEMMAQGLIPNQQEAAKIVLEAMDLPEIDKLLTRPDPEPNPEMEFKNRELDHKIQIEQAEVQMKGARLALDEDIADDMERKYETEMLLNIAKAEAQEEGTQLGIYNAELDRIRLKMDAREKDKAEKTNETRESTES